MRLSLNSKTAEIKAKKEGITLDNLDVSNVFI